MYTDWLLIRRLAWELDDRCAGARVRDVGQLQDGRLALEIWSRGGRQTVCIDVFAPTPTITLQAQELPVAVEPGFVRAAGAALRASTLLAVRSLDRDRVLRFDFGLRSRFGVPDGYALICELVPRFGNVVLVKHGAHGDSAIVAAAKEFEATASGGRTIRVGSPYQAPPSRPGNISPLLSDGDAARLAGQSPQGELHVYRRDGVLVQAHLTQLPQFAELEHERSASLLDVLQEARRSDALAAQSDRSAKRRRSVERALAQRERKARAELAQTQARLRDAAGRESLRDEGQAIYATLHELDATAQRNAKERAGELFAAYKKAAAAVEHLERRCAELTGALEEIASLRWELERAQEADLDDVAQAVDPARSGNGARRVKTRKRSPLVYRTGAGSRIYVGRTPIENVDLTFRLARPDDLWFHVQNQPGAHVILQRDDKTPAPQNDVLAAAALAAAHSQAKSSPKVSVDYTLRKHVRKRPAAAPGLVFYTHPKTVQVAPGSPPDSG